MNDATPPSGIVAIRDRARRSLDGVNLEQLLGTRALVGPNASEVAGLAAAAMRALDNEDRPTPEQLQALETAIRALRPFVFVKRGALEPLPTEAARLFPEWGTFSDEIKQFLSSVGKISRPDRQGNQEEIGTGFLIGPEALVTNHHVLRILARGTDALIPNSASVRFGQEVVGAEPEAIDLVDVAEVHPTLDVAILKLQAGAAVGPPIPVLPNPVLPLVGAQVAAIGFPLSSETNALSIEMLDNESPGMKRGSPGEVLGTTDVAIDHDCSTMPGSSGSPLFAMDDGTLVGVHGEGVAGTRNGAIPIAAIHVFLQRWTA